MREKCDRVVLRDSGSQGDLNDAAGWKIILSLSASGSSSRAAENRNECLQHCLVLFRTKDKSVPGLLSSDYRQGGLPCLCLWGILGLLDLPEPYSALLPIAPTDVSTCRPS